MVENRGSTALLIDLLTCAAVPLPQVMSESAEKAETKKGFSEIPNGNPTAIELDEFELNARAALQGTDAGFLLQGKDPPSLALLAASADTSGLIEIEAPDDEKDKDKQARLSAN